MPWMFNYVDSMLVNHIIQQQNVMLSQIASHLESMANDHSGLWSFWASVIIGLIALWTAFRQNEISKKQHNLELFDKRWALLEELRILGNEYFDFPHSATPEEGMNDPDKNYCLLDNKLKLFNNKSFVIMGKKTYDELENLRQKCMEYHQLQMKYWQVKSKLEMWDAIYAGGTESKEDIQQQETNLVHKIGETQIITYSLWNDIHKIFVQQIQDKKIE